MNKLEKIYQNLLLFVEMMTSILKIAVFSKREKSQKGKPWHKEVVILGNGPSLKNFLSENISFLNGKDCVTVNKSCFSPLFSQIKPLYHVFADPLFFKDESTAKVFDSLNETVNWNMTLFIPFSAKKQPLWKAKEAVLRQNPSIHIAFYNMTKISGPESFVRKCIEKGWGMPAPRNVLVPSIVHCLRMEYERLYLAGADHSWVKELWVSDDNEVMIDDQHYYDTPSDKTIQKTVKLSTVLRSFSIALDSYEVLNTYAVHKNVKIYNITPGSYIDVFERMKI